MLGSSSNTSPMNPVETIHSPTGRYCFQNVEFFTAENRISRRLSESLGNSIFRSMKSLLKEYITEILRSGTGRNEDPRLVELLNLYVGDARSMSEGERRDLAKYVANSTLPPGLMLERISKSIPNENVGDTISFGLASFTKTSVSTGKNAGVIGWKSSDKCIFMIKNPQRGLEVNYDLVKTQFDSFLEEEVILTGNYKIVSKIMISEPGTKPSYGYQVPLYELQET